MRYEATAIWQMFRVVIVPQLVLLVLFINYVRIYYLLISSFHNHIVE